MTHNMININFESPSSFEGHGTSRVHFFRFCLIQNIMTSTYYLRRYLLHDDDASKLVIIDNILESSSSY